MPKTAGQKLGSLLLPLYVLAILSGMAAGAGAGAVVSGISVVQRAIEPELAAGWGAGGVGIIPVLVGLPIGALMALGPATGSVVALFVQAWKAPFPTIRDQARAAARGACAAASILAGGVYLLNGGDPVGILGAGAAYALVSFLLASAITARLLRHLGTRQGFARDNRFL